MPTIKTIAIVLTGAVLFYFFIANVVFLNVEKLNTAREEELAAITSYCEGVKRVNDLKKESVFLRKRSAEKEAMEDLKF